jgi:hypothetical protein
VTYYLDTSAHLERHGGAPDVQAAIAGLLGDETHASSSHAEREWKRIVHGCASDILNVLQVESSLQGVRARLRQGFDRVVTQRWLVYDMLIDGDDCTVEELAHRARRHIRTGFHAMFNDRVDVRDGSQCAIARRAASPDEAGKWRYPGTCKKSESICDQVAFLRSQQPRVLTAAQALQHNASRDADKELGRKTEQRMRLADTELKGQNCYAGKGVGGDIAIALECAPDEILLTSDESFEHICPALGLNHHRLTGTRMPA